MSSVREEHGMACPKCGSDEKLEVCYTSWTRLVPDGTDDDDVLNRDIEFDDESACLCDACGWRGTVADARVEGQS